MTDQELQLLKRKWKYQNKWRTFGKVMGKMEGFGTMDLSKDGVIGLYEGKTEYKCELVDRTLEIFIPSPSKNDLRLRITELTLDTLTVIVSMKPRDNHEKLEKDIVELEYSPMTDD